MKHMKKALSLLLVMAMVMGMTFVPVMAASRSDYKVALVGTKEEVGTNKNKVVSVEFQVQGALLAGTQQAMIKYDKSKLTLARFSNGNKNLTIPTASYEAVSSANSAALSYYDEENEEDVTVFGQPTIYAREMGDYVVVGIQVSPISATTNYCNGSLKTIGSFKLALNDGVSYDDLDSTSIQWATADEAHDCNQCAAVFVNDAANDIGHNIYNTVPDTFATAPTLTYPGSDKTVSIPITGIDVSLNKTTVAVPTAGKTDTTVTATAAAAPTGATLPDDVKYTIDPAYTGVSVNATSGVVTVSPSAAAGTVTVKAASASKSLSGTASLTLTKAAAVATTITLSKTAAQVGNIKIPQAGQTGTYSISATVKDQYGVTMTGQTVSINSIDGITYNGTALQVTDAVTTGSKTVTFSVSSTSASASLTLTVVKGDGPAAPTGITGEDATTKGGNGKLKGVNDTMEYKASSASTWTAVPSGATEVAVPAGSYTVRVKETTKYNAGTATAAITISQPGTSATPTVTVTPSSAQLSEKNPSVVLTAAVSGTNVTEANCTFQWKKDGSDITGATSKTYTATEVGTYTCVVTHTAGSNDPATGTSNAVTVTMKQRTAITLAAKTGEVAAREEGWVLADVVNANVPITFDVEETEDPAVFVNDDLGITVTFYEGDEKAEEILTGVEYKVVIEVAADVSVGDDYTLKATETPVESTITFVAGKQGYDKPYINGIMDDDGVVKFMPSNKITRGMVATVMARLSKDFDENETYTCDLPDYNGDGWSGNFVAFCASKGIIGGVEWDGTLMALPKNNITRAEFAKMLALTVGIEVDENDTEYKFDDELDGSTSWAVPYINALQKAHVVEGSDDDGDGKFSFKPADAISRAEVVAMVNRAFELADAVAGAKYDTTFPDVAESDWFWKYVMPAANVPVCDFLK